MGNQVVHFNFTAPTSVIMWNSQYEEERGSWHLNVYRTPRYNGINVERSTLILYSEQDCTPYESEHKTFHPSPSESIYDRNTLRERKKI